MLKCKPGTTHARDIPLELVASVKIACLHQPEFGPRRINDMELQSGAMIMVPPGLHRKISLIVSLNRSLHELETSV